MAGVVAEECRDLLAGRESEIHIFWRVGRCRATSVETCVGGCERMKRGGWSGVVVI